MFIYSPWFQICNAFSNISKTRHLAIIPYRINQMRPVAKRDNLYTLSLFALKLWLFRLKFMLELRERAFKNVDKFF